MRHTPLITLIMLAGCGRQAAPIIDEPLTTQVAVYYAIDTRLGPRLARETHDVPADHAVESAVRAMIDGPDDPDYTTTWNAATHVQSVHMAGDVITVDLSDHARRANVGSAGAALMIQQLVYTVTSASNPLNRVLLTIDGKPAGELWGVVSWDSPVARESPFTVRAPVQIDAPRERAIASSPLTVKGEAAAVESILPWRVLNRSGHVVASGTTRTSEGQRFARFEFSAPLPPGRYRVEVSEDHPNDGTVGPRMVDTRTVSVMPMRMRRN